MKVLSYINLIIILLLLGFVLFNTKVPTKPRIYLERLLAPGYSVCHKCGRPWKFAKPHHTFFTATRGCFPLCQECWSGLTPEKRLPYYKELWIEWGSDPNYAKWEDMEKAVLEGR